MTDGIGGTDDGCPVTKAIIAEHKAINEDLIRGLKQSLTNAGFWVGPQNRTIAVKGIKSTVTGSGHPVLEVEIGGPLGNGQTYTARVDVKLVESHLG